MIANEGAEEEDISYLIDDTVQMGFIYMFLLD